MDLTIRQLEGPRRTLRLSGRALPLQGYSLGTRQRGRMRHYPGASEAQVLLEGPEELPTSFSFLWRTRWLSGPSASAALLPIGPIDSADRLVEVVREMVRDSVLVSVELAGREPVGYLSEVEVEVGLPGEYRVDLEVEWSVPERLTPSTGLSLTRLDPSDLLGDILAGWANALSVLRLPAMFSRDRLAEAELGINRINAGFRSAATLVEEYRAAVIDSDAVLRGASTALATIEEGAVAVGAAVARPWGVLVETDDPEVALRTWSFSARLARAAAAARRRAIVERRRMLLDRDGDVLGYYTAREGDDLRLVSWRAYGNASLWREVGRRNELSGSTLSAGQVLVLPRLGR
jgi:hypothetical protein